MKTTRIFLAILILNISTLTLFAQKKPEAKMFNEMVNLFCTEENRSRTDNFLIEVINNPDAKGYVIGYADAAIPGRFLKYFETLQNHIAFRKASAERFTFLRGANQNKMLFQFWIVPANAEPPEPENKYSYEKISSPTLFDESRIASVSKNKVVFGSQSDEPCDWGLNLKDFAEFLKADSNLNAHLTVYADNEKGKPFAETALKLTLQELVSKHKIPRQRLQINYVGAREERKMELWLIPKGETK